MRHFSLNFGIKAIYFLFLYLVLISCNSTVVTPSLDSEISSNEPSKSKINDSKNNQPSSSSKLSDSSSDSSLRKDCILSGGEVVKSGWKGKDTGDNFCNNCFCNNGNLGCTKMYCNKDVTKVPILTQIPIPTQMPFQTPTPTSSTSESYKLISGSLSGSFASIVAVLLPQTKNQDVKFRYKFIFSESDKKPKSIGDFCDSIELWSKTIDSSQNSVQVPQSSFPEEEGFIHLCVSFSEGYGNYSDWLRLNQTVQINTKKDRNSSDETSKILCCNQYSTSARYKIKEQIKIPGKSDPITQYAIGVTKEIEGAIIFDSSGKIHSEIPSAIVVNLSSLKSDSSLRDSYLKNNSLEINKYPKLTLTVKNVDELKWPLVKGVYQNFKLYGDLEIHGVLKPSVWDVEAILEGGNITGTAKTQFYFGDFNIKIPKVYVVYVEDKIELEMNFSATYLE